MTEIENREILGAILELLKTQMNYVRNLHESLSVLYDALKNDHPKLEENQTKEMEKIRDNPWQTGQIDELDALLQRLKELDVSPQH